MQSEKQMTTAAMIGYARTSTVDQEAGFAAQLRDLTEIGCTKIFSEKVSSVAKGRPQLEAALEYVREGDTLVVTRLDRLARSVKNLKDIQEELVRKCVELRVLNIGLDTSTPTGKLMLNLLGSIAEFERELMLERQREGIAAAKEAGVYKGRKPTARAKANQVIQMKAEGASARLIAERLDIGTASVFRILKEAKAA
jgi:DNA invertase Pin-like site-specific DNA recombinase